MENGWCFPTSYQQWSKEGIVGIEPEFENALESNGNIIYASVISYCPGVVLISDKYIIIFI